MNMYGLIVFDRPIDKNRHEIFPGGYSITFEDGTCIEFDFENFKGWVQENKLRIVCSDLDTEEYPDAENLWEKLKTTPIDCISEFFVDTGLDAPEIHPIGLESLSFEEGDEIFVVDTPEILKTAGVTDGKVVASR